MLIAWGMHRTCSSPSVMHTIGTYGNHLCGTRHIWTCLNHCSTQWTWPMGEQVSYESWENQHIQTLADISYRIATQQNTTDKLVEQLCTCIILWIYLPHLHCHMLQQDQWNVRQQRWGRVSCNLGKQEVLAGMLTNTLHVVPLHVTCIVYVWVDYITAMACTWIG